MIGVSGVSVRVAAGTFRLVAVCGPGRAGDPDRWDGGDAAARALVAGLTSYP
ncbi:hypothetical protein [Prauserella alba]|uniref:hypothetical protein n=1 Tax=Prauserella alba TaxID=176898 RepID=UPI0020A2A94B|nr:hypothetical protein [Prauserella alba]MCP2179372.1 hypothetical protein [Prauserella alba]